MIKRYVGHIGVESKSRACSGQSRTCTPFAPTMSVRLIGHFWPFSKLFARRALCSAPQCTPDAWTNGQNMLCCLCILVPIADMPRRRTEAPTHNELGQGKCEHFCHFGAYGLNSGHHHAIPVEIIQNQIQVGPHWTPIRSHNECGVPSPSPHGGMLLGIPSFLAHFRVCRITPFGTPISAPHVIIWRPHVFESIRSPDPIPSLALRYDSQVLPPIP